MRLGPADHLRLKPLGYRTTHKKLLLRLTELHILHKMPLVRSLLLE
jgi:hypothetical protein